MESFRKTFLVLQLICLFCYGCCNWIDAMENGYFEGDMILSPEEINNYLNGTKSYSSMISGRWPNGIIPYIIQTSIEKKGVDAINDAIAQYHKHTCLKFVKQTTERVFINFHKSGGCSSPVGYSQFRVNNVELGTSCWSIPTVLHEIGHSIGLYHEQSRPDRDNYIEILWNNIFPSDMKTNFEKRKTIEVDSLNTKYDLSSMMHYGSNVFGFGKMTIKTKDPTKQSLIGQRNGFSTIDIKQINLMYNCEGKVQSTVLPAKTFKPTVNCDNKKLQCNGWAKTGYCNAVESNFKVIMKRDCCKACKETAVCPDLKIECAKWSRQGYCSKNSKHFKYMSDNCRKSCKLCV